MGAYRSSKVVSIDEFSAARRQLNSMIAFLASGKAMDWAHGKIEGYIKEEGNEMLRLLLQAHLDCRAQHEDRLGASQGADGVERNHLRERSTRQLESLFGRISVARRGYGSPGYESLFPLDATLNLPPDLYSHGMRRVVGIEVAGSSFDEVVAAIAEHTGGHIPKRQVEKLAAVSSQDFDVFYAQRRFEVGEDTRAPLVMSVDGKGIVVRREDLRDATRKAAEQASPKLKHRLTKGEKPHRKRMATVAAVFTQERLIRTPEEIMGLLDSSDEAKRHLPRPEHKRVFATIERTSIDAMDEVFQEALRRDPEKERQWVMLVDGERHQIDRVHKTAKKYGVDVVIIVDFIHVLEYLWSAASCFHEAGTPEAEEWVTERALKILRGQSSHVAAGMRRSATRRSLATGERKAVDICADYLLNKRPYLRYDEYLADGLAIATGVIEGACRYLVKDRLDVTGARWSLAGAEAVLRLRALRASGDFDEYWTFHLEQELQRNHVSRFQGGVIPLARAA